MSEKQYLKCSAKARDTQYGEVLNLSIKVEDLADFCRKFKNERGYLNLTIAARREVGQYGDTHSVYLDAYANRPPATGAGARRDAALRGAPTGHRNHAPHNCDGEDPIPF